MSKITLSLKVRNTDTDSTLEWPGETCAANGLAICKRPWRCMGDEKPEAVDTYGIGWNTFEGWQIVHIRSGFVLPRCESLSSKKRAQDRAEYLSQLDWDKDQNEISSNDTYRLLVKELDY